jgi:hypothetical protein
METYHVKPRHFINKGRLDALRYGDKEDLDKLVALFNDQASHQNGMNKKTETDIYHLKRMKSGQILVHETDKINGYMIFTQESLGLANKQAQKVVVKEAIYNREALHDFISFLHVQDDQVDYVEWASHDSNLHYLMDQVVFESEPKSLEIISHKVSEKALGLMPLVLDCEKILKRVGKRTRQSIKFIIHHPKAAVEEWYVHFSTKPLIIECNINEFSSWVTGTIGLNDLYQRGLIQVNKAELLESLDDEFNFKKPINLSRY